MDSADLVIVGAGGLGTEFAWVAGEMSNSPDRSGAAKRWRAIGYADDASAKKGETSGGLQILGTIEEAVGRLSGRPVHFAVAVGDSTAREKLVRRAETAGWRPATLIHPSVIIAKDARIGEGSYLAPGCVVCPGACVANHVIVNTHASVGHHSILEDYSQICPGARINGGCRVGKHAFIGSNASLNPRVVVGQGSVVGANSLAIRNVAPGTTVLGCPAMAATGRRFPGKSTHDAGDRSNG